MAEKYDSQILRFDTKDKDGSNVFFEVLNSALPIGKVQINFGKNEAGTNKQVCRLDLYIDTTKALALCQMLIDGTIDRRIATAKTSGFYNKQKVSPYTSYWTDMGGINFHDKTGKFNPTKQNQYDKMKEMFPWLTNDKDISRQLKIQESTAYKYVFRAEYGLGHADENGLIVPEGMAKNALQVPMSEDAVYEFATVLKANIEAYYAQYYSKFGNTLFTNQKCNVFTSTPKK